jgi:hypothetical protein
MESGIGRPRPRGQGVTRLTELPLAGCLQLQAQS